MRALTVAMSALILCTWSPSGANEPGSDESLPKIILRAGGQEQRGHIWTSTEVEGQGNGCVAGHGDGVPTPPRRSVNLERDPFQGRLLIRRDEEPRIHLRGYSELDEYGSLEFDPSHKVRWRLKPLPSATGPVRWIVKFRAEPRDHLYLDLTASWKDPSGCGRDEASYLFHLADR